MYRYHCDHLFFSSSFGFSSVHDQITRMGLFGKRFSFRQSDRVDSTVDGEPVRSVDSGSSSGGRTDKDKGLASGVQVSAETELEANRKVEDLEREHQWDPNLPQDTLQELDEANHTGDLGKELNLVHLFEDNSPYPEVRAAVRNVGITKI